MSTTIQQILQTATQQMAAQHDTARLDAELLLAHVLHKSRAWLYTWPEHKLDAQQIAQFNQLVQRRAQGEPVAHLIGQQAFWSLSLQVTADTLIPRPETELLVEKALEQIPQGATWRIADLGTGSGAIVLALARERPHWEMYALDRAPACIDVARRNALRMKTGNLGFVLGDWSTAFADSSLDAIVSNPPYVNAGDPHLLSGDVRFEPLTALVAGNDGLDDIRQLIKDAQRVLKSGGHLLLEHAPQQTGHIHNLLKQMNFKDISTHRDLAGHERVSSARKSL